MPEPASACPRCGYDQSGVVVSWADRCPLGGVCSECGLDFSWRDVLSPVWTVPQWSFEHCRGWWQVGKHTRTCLHALFFWHFWRAIRMEHPLRSSRLWRHVGAMLLASHLVLAASASWRAWHIAMRVAPWWWAGPGSRGRSAAPGEEAARAAADAFLWPYWQVHLLGSPVIWQEHAFGRDGVFLLLWMGATPLGFLVLTETFRRVRVRFVHLWRGLAYSTTVVPVCTMVLVLYRNEWLAARVDALTGASGFGLSAIRGDVSRWLVAIAAAWHMLFWWAMVRFYLRLPHAEGVTAAMLLISALLGLILMLIVFVVQVAAVI